MLGITIISLIGKCENNYYLMQTQSLYLTHYYFCYIWLLYLRDSICIILLYVKALFGKRQLEPGWTVLYRIEVNIWETLSAESLLSWISHVRGKVWLLLCAGWATEAAVYSAITPHRTQHALPAVVANVDISPPIIRYKHFSSQGWHFSEKLFES